MAPGSIKPCPTRNLSGLDSDCLMNILMFLDVESRLRFQVAFPAAADSQQEPKWLAGAAVESLEPATAGKHFVFVSSMPLSRCLLAWHSSAQQQLPATASASNVNNFGCIVLCCSSKVHQASVSTL